jgi:hypothetical protein
MAVRARESVRRGAPITPVGDNERRRQHDDDECQASQTIDDRERIDDRSG